MTSASRRDDFVSSRGTGALRRPRPEPDSHRQASEVMEKRPRPLPEAEWNRERAAHLLDRAGFGGTPQEAAALAVTQLVRWQKQPNVPLPAFDESHIFPNSEFVPPPDSQIREIVARAAVERRGLGVRLSGP